MANDLSSGLSSLAGDGLVFAFAPGNDPVIELLPEGNSLNGYGHSAKIWPFTGDFVEIPVCWTFTSALFSSKEERENVRLAVKNTWEAYSLVRFTGWGTCPVLSEDPNSVHIHVENPKDEGSFTHKLGTELRGLKPGVVLNLKQVSNGLIDPKNSNENKPKAGCDSDMSCAVGSAVHEFGHVLGFVHEQDRLDTKLPFRSCYLDPKEQPKQQDPDIADTYIGPWDIDSVMNYCNPTLNGAGKLSAGDIAMLKIAYDRVPIKMGDMVTFNYVMVKNDQGYYDGPFKATLRPDPNDPGALMVASIDLTTEYLPAHAATYFDGQDLRIDYLFGVEQAFLDGFFKFRATPYKNIVARYNPVKMNFRITNIETM